MDWKNNLPESVREWQEVKQSDTPEKFFDQVANMRKYMGQSIRIPSKDAGDDQLNEFYNNLQAKVPGLMRAPNPEDDESIEHVFKALGKPDDEKAYTVDREDVAEAELEDLRAMAKDVGMTKAQFKKFADGMLNINKSAQEKNRAALENEQNSLKSDWGAAFDERLNSVLDIAEATGASNGLVESIKNKTVDAHTAKWLYQLGKQLGGEAVNAHVQQKTMAPEEASETINDILNNAAHPYWDTAHPDHSKAVEKVIKLHRLSNGQAASG
jgi:hypothetical protein